jgi:hypothetical protein
VLAYTRVGCRVDPEGWIGPDGAVPVSVLPAAPGRLTRIVVEHAHDQLMTDTLPGRARSTCVSHRSPGGRWQPFTMPAAVTVDGRSARAEFILDGVPADAVAIFLPTYAYLSRITYELGPQPP